MLVISGRALLMGRTFSMAPIEPDRLSRHLRHLTETIGVRLAGCPGEAAAADYVAKEFAAAGARVHLETFPVQARDSLRSEAVSGNAARAGELCF